MTDENHDHSKHNSHKRHDSRQHEIQEVDWSGLQVGILTLSDSRDKSRDKSGDALEQLVLSAKATLSVRDLVVDDFGAIKTILTAWTDQQKLDVILTTGGTGPSPRDVTPEVTREICNRELPGFGELIRQAGLLETRNAVFTRGIAAFRHNTLVINLPGSTRGAATSFKAIADLVPHALKMAHGQGH